MVKLQGIFLVVSMEKIILKNLSHLNGMFYRTIRMMENGIKPVYVFDGKPPELKSGELEKRGERRAEAQEQLTAAKARGDAIAVEKFERRLVKVFFYMPMHCFFIYPSHFLITLNFIFLIINF